VIPYYRPFVEMQKSKEGPSYELPLAATYVIDTGGVIRYAFLDADYTHRPEPQKILSVLHRLKRDAASNAASQPLARR
jgi:peroxiredoxin